MPALYYCDVLLRKTAATLGTSLSEPASVFVESPRETVETGKEIDFNVQLFTRIRTTRKMKKNRLQIFQAHRFVLVQPKFILSFLLMMFPFFMFSISS